MSRPPHQNPYNPYVTAPQTYPYQQQPAYPFPYPQYNLTGGYQPYPSYPNIPQQPHYYQNPYAPPQPTYGQSLFVHNPSATPEGYSYSSNYHQLAQSDAGPSKRPRVDGPSQGGGGGDMSGMVKAWRNCSQPGCKFVGSGEDVEIHEGDRHLIFPAGYKAERSEEEERFAKMKGPAPTIEGTGIRLETEEDIAKWVAERKAKWPSRQRVVEKAEDRNAAMARGEMPRGRGRGRGRGGASRDDATSRAEDWGREPPEVMEDRDGFRGRGRGRGQSRGRDAARGRGRGRGGQHQEGGEGKREADTGWPGHGAPPAPTTPTSAPTSLPPIPPKALGLLGEYESVSSSSTSDISSSSSSSDSDSETDAKSDSEDAPDMDLNEGQTMAADLELVVEAIEDEPAISIKSDPRKVCKFFAKGGRCRAGQKCKFAHSLTGAEPGLAIPKSQQSNRPKAPRQPPTKPINQFARPSMLSSLLEVPIQNTLSQLSQTIRFLVANDMLRNVELEPGQADEQMQGERKIVII